MKITFSEGKIFSSYLLINLAYYSSLPYLAIYLKILFNLSPSNIAIIIAAGPISSCCASILFGKQIDLYNKKKGILFCLSGSVLIYGLFSLTKDVIWFLLANSLIGFFRGIIDTIFKTYLACEFSNKIAAFGYRAIVINVSASIGPLLGFYFANHGNMFLFFLCALTQILASLIIFIVMPKYIKIPRFVEPLSHLNLNKENTLLRKNKTFIYLLMAIIFSNACYSQLDSSLPIILSDRTQDGIKLYFLLLTTNAFAAILLQPTISFIITRYNWFASIKIGLGCFLIAFLIPIFTLSLVALFIMIIIFTMAELLIFQAGYLAIDKISPFQSKGQYYGIANLDMIGAFLGPLIGCGIYQLAGVKTMFLSICILLVIPAYFFLMQSSIQIRRAREA